MNESNAFGISAEAVEAISEAAAAAGCHYRERKGKCREGCMKDYQAGSATSISILCREINKYTGEIAVYLCKKNVDSRVLHD